MSTTTTSPNSPSPSPATLSQPLPSSTDSYDRALHYASLTTLFAAPALVLLPPRKLDLYTFSLCVAFVTSANYQTRQRTGLGVLQWMAARRGEREWLKKRVNNMEGTRRNEVMLVEEEEKEALGTSKDVRGLTFPSRRRQDDWAARGALLGADGQARVRMQLLRQRQRNDGMILQTVGAGGDAEANLGQAQREGRIQNERDDDDDDGDDEAEEKGISDRIVEQIWDVWNWNSNSNSNSNSVGGQGPVGESGEFVDDKGK